MKYLYKKRVLVAATLIVLFLGTLAAVQVKRPPNILLILVDTTRSDALSVHGYNRPTPALDNFARESLHFTNGFTAAPWTPAAVSSLFFGMTAVSHGLNEVFEFEDVPKKGWGMPACAPTIAELLRDHGYSTNGISANQWISASTRFDRGFDRFIDIPRKIAIAGYVNQLAFSELDSLKKKGKPWFLYLHYFDPHTPYAPPQRYGKQFQCGERSLAGLPEEEKLRAERNCYDAEISYFDAEFQALIDGLKKRGLYDDMVVALVSDHGEGFREHGTLGHGKQLYNEELKVPIFVHAPKHAAAHAIDRAVSLIDIAPTLLQAASAPVPANMQGVSLFDEHALASRPALLATIHRFRRPQFAVVSPDGTKFLGKECREQGATVECQTYELLSARSASDEVIESIDG